MFEVMNIAKRGNYFCYLCFEHIGMATPLEEKAQRIVGHLAANDAKEIVFVHDDCYSMLSKMKEYDMDVLFKATHII